MSDHPAVEELKKYKAHLRATEDELAEARAAIARLKEENRSLHRILRRHEEQARYGGRPLAPEATAGDDDAVWVSGRTGHRLVEDVDTGDAL